MSDLILDQHPPLFVGSSCPSWPVPLWTPLVQFVRLSGIIRDPVLGASLPEPPDGQLQLDQVSACQWQAVYSGYTISLSVAGNHCQFVCRNASTGQLVFSSSYYDSPQQQSDNDLLDNGSNPYYGGILQWLHPNPSVWLLEDLAMLDAAGVLTHIVDSPQVGTTYSVERTQDGTYCKFRLKSLND